VGSWNRFRRAAAAYRQLLVARVRSDWQYRASFVLFTVGQALVAVVDFVALVVLFVHVPAIRGWSLPEVAFLYGAAGVAHNLGDTFLGGAERTSFHIKGGTFDRFLVRPVGSLLQLTAQEFAFRRMGKVLQAAVVLGVATAAVEVPWTVGRVMMFPVMLLAGMAIYGAVWVITASISFWTVETNEVANAFTYGGNQFAQYPLEVYGRWVRHLFTVVVPVAFVAYFPALYILDKDTGAPAWAAFIAPAVACIAVIVAHGAWAFAVRHYRSTGS
jgi:ABC-2 type transport system permease protein